VIIKLLSYNIRFGGVGREERIARVIEAISPDLVVFQEAIVPDVVGKLSALTSMPFWASKANHSIAYLSRLKVDYQEWHTPGRLRHPYLEIFLEENQTRIFGLHLRAMLSKWGERRRVQEIKALMENIKKHQAGFHILVGDFNSLAPGDLLNTRKMPAWIRTLIWLSGRDIQRETIGTMLELGYIDGFRLLNTKEAGYTFPSWNPHIRFDYGFLPNAFSDKLKSCQVITNLPEIEKASDHLPLLVHLEI
jgi:endonuclease/exonuclease/phosphatase family metal-dependent hydrolase